MIKDGKHINVTGLLQSFIRCRPWFCLRCWLSLDGIFFSEFLICGSLSSESTRNVRVRTATKAISQEECLQTLVCNSTSTKNGSADEMERGRIKCNNFCNLQNRTNAVCKADCECDCRNVTCTFERRADKTRNTLSNAQKNDTPHFPMFCMAKSLYCSGKPQNHSNKNLK